MLPGHHSGPLHPCQPSHPYLHQGCPPPHWRVWIHCLFPGHHQWPGTGQSVIASCSVRQYFWHGYMIDLWSLVPHLILWSCQRQLGMGDGPLPHFVGRWLCLTPWSEFRMPWLPYEGGGTSHLVQGAIFSKQGTLGSRQWWVGSVSETRYPQGSVGAWGVLEVQDSGSHWKWCPHSLWECEQWYIPGPSCCLW